jgi:hypothetical protein
LLIILFRAVLSRMRYQKYSALLYNSMTNDGFPRELYHGHD